MWTQEVQPPLTQDRQFLTDDERAEIRSAERYFAGKVVKYVSIALIIIGVFSVVSLAVWQPWAAKQEAKIQTETIVHGPAYVTAKNARLANLLREATSDQGDQIGALVNDIRTTAEELDWDEITEGNQLLLCRPELDRARPSDARCS